MTEGKRDFRKYIMEFEKLGSQYPPIVYDLLDEIDRLEGQLRDIRLAEEG